MFPLLILAFLTPVATAPKPYAVPPDRVWIANDVKGPILPTRLPPAKPTPWTAYAQGPRSSMAILLTDPSSPWLGLAHGLKAAGLPFIITTDYQTALNHQVVMIYPLVSGKALSQPALQALAAVPRNGGTLIGFGVQGGGLQEVFGFQEAVPSRDHERIHFAPHVPLLGEAPHPHEQTIRIGFPNSSGQNLGTFHFSKPSNPPLATYEDGTAAITQKPYEKGGAYAFGFDLGFLLCKGFNNREERLSRTYVNGYEPALDVLLRILIRLYQKGEPHPCVLDPVPYGKSLAVILTHDIDYRKSTVNALEYAKWENSQGLRATYFMQTKYVKDFYDKIFFDPDGIALLRQIKDLGMEIASHSVSHSRTFAQFETGTGLEQYPAYQPFIQEQRVTHNGTVLGELRVSKYLLDHFLGEGTVQSFRPGHLSNPYALPQLMEATGYRYSSSVTANNSLTHLPFQLLRDRSTDEGVAVYEFPVTIEDEALPKLGDRLPEALEVAKHISRSHGCFIVLIHPDILDHKLDFEKKLVAALRPTAWFGALSEFGRWWRARDRISIGVRHDGADRSLLLDCPEPIDGLAFTLPNGYRLRTRGPNGGFIKQEGSHVVLDHAEGALEFELHPER